MQCYALKIKIDLVRPDVQPLEHWENVDAKNFFYAQKKVLTRLKKLYRGIARKIEVISYDIVGYY